MLEKLLSDIASFVWGTPMLILFLGTGILFTVRSSFFQLRIDRWLSGTVGKAIRQRSAKPSQGAISPYRALCTALAACMGTGNIAGVATALTSGGPGAVFWMCFCAFFSMMTSYVETALAVRYRVRKQGEWLGGAMLYMEKGLGMKSVAKLYAVLLAAASFGIGSMSQVNSAALATESIFKISPLTVGIVFCVLAVLTVCGGLKRVAGTAEKMVPFMSAVFMISALTALFVCRENIPYAFQSIWKGAFGIKAVSGGIVGYSFKKAVQTGISRGVFSNEAGLGSTTVIHASSDVKSPHEQGLWGILEVFLDTVVMCTVTALVILSSGVWEETSFDGSVLFAKALSVSLGKTGEAITAITLCLLGFASVMGWYCCGEKGVLYAFGKKGVVPYRILYCISLIPGSILGMNAVWSISDILNCFMAIPNLISIIFLSRRELRCIKGDKSVKAFITE